MIKSLLRKIIYVILLLWIVSLISFWLSNQVPGDEVMDYISIDERGYNPNVDPNQFRNIYQRVARLRGLDLPGFYFSIHPGYIPDTIQRILPLDDRKVVKQWIHFSGNGEAAGNLYIQLRSGLTKYCNTDRILCNHFSQSLAENAIVDVRSNSMSLIDSLKKDSTRNEIAIRELGSIVQSTNDLLAPRKWNVSKIIPAIRWNGSNNQYHQWMRGLVL